MVRDLFDIDAPAGSATASATGSEDSGDDAGATIVLRLHVQPGAGRTAVSGRYGDALKVRVAAPPEGGRANDACQALVAELLGVGKSAVELVSGPASRSKRYRVSGVDVAEVERLLEEAIHQAGTRPGAGRPPR